MWLSTLPFTSVIFFPWQIKIIQGQGLAGGKLLRQYGRPIKIIVDRCLHRRGCKAEDGTLRRDQQELKGHGQDQDRHEDHQNLAIDRAEGD